MDRSKRTKPEVQNAEPEKSQETKPVSEKIKDEPVIPTPPEIGRAHV